MRLRLAAHLFIAAMIGAVAGFVGNANAEKTPAAQAARQAPAPMARQCPLPKQYRAAFRAAAKDSGLPMALLVAVARVESNVRHDALSGAGARGLLQLMPATAASLRLDPDRPATNVLAGARYLRQQLERFRSADLALAAYNAGPTAVERAGGAPTDGTLSYVANVNAHWRALHGCS